MYTVYATRDKERVGRWCCYAATRRIMRIALCEKVRDFESERQRTTTQKASVAVQLPVFVEKKGKCTYF